MAGLSVVGRDDFGVFPLRGKLMNVRDVSVKAALENTEIAHLITILGLDLRRSYAGVAPEERGLRYGRVMIMTDQDQDGVHIAGLLINMFHTLWPALVEEGGFLAQFITPLIKVRVWSLPRRPPTSLCSPGLGRLARSARAPRCMTFSVSMSLQPGKLP